MVYRGKPSAGCEACRKAKKKCDLEQPSCSRCRKLGKACSGYRDTSQLQIHDESETVRLKLEKPKSRAAAASRSFEHRPRLNSSNPSTPGSLSSSSSSAATTISSSSEQSTYQEPKELPLISFREPVIVNEELASNVHPSSDFASDNSFHKEYTVSVPSSIKPAPDDIAVNFFFSNFTSPLGQWTWIRELFTSGRPDRVLDLAVRACGVAALDNVRGLGIGANKSRFLYAEALRVLNSALRDPILCRKDSSLIAVQLLGMYENLTCDSLESITSWKAHMDGSAKLLQVRGKSQFKTYAGRQVFREVRAQILIHSMWDDLEAPKFLWESDADLKKHSHPLEVAVMIPGDRLGIICLEYASIRHRFRNKTISDAAAMEALRRVEVSMIQWSIETRGGCGATWTYRDVKVEDSPHVWNGVVHEYSELPPVASVWNMYRSIRIMLTRTQEQLLRRIQLPAKDAEAQLAYLKSVRREQANDICRSMPTQLGLAWPARNSPCVLITAYGSIWPLFFAGTCALEQVGLVAWMRVRAGRPLNDEATSEATAQASWIIGRMEYISKHLGLRWADGLAATLNGDFQKHHDIPLEQQKRPPTEPDLWRRQMHSSDLGPAMMQRWNRVAVEYGMLEDQDIRSEI